jgi:hypothetical protein
VAFFCAKGDETVLLDEAIGHIILDKAHMRLHEVSPERKWEKG